ncbi:histamine N-methyltransferase-like [Rhopilema esculentum]|uniref:histamine N-methyltransferase-like n=1 Tax=Rhopilema esculentum TaxID=499914 RepID=UPI0031DD917E|eukprot:gene16833-8304_t
MASNHLCNDGTTYQRVFEVYSRGFFEQQRNWIANILVPRFVDKLGLKSNSSNLRVLAVGSGVGSADIRLLDELFSGAKDFMSERKIQWIVVEPDGIAMKTFKDIISKRSEDFKNIEFVWINKRFEEYIDGIQTADEQFDFIHFFNVLYYMDQDVVLKKAYERLLQKQGMLLCVVGSQGDIWKNMIEAFQFKIDLSHFQQPTNVDLCKIAETYSWDYEMFDGKLDLEITQMFIENNPVGKAMLQFFLQTTNDPKELLGEELYAELINFFKSQSWEVVNNGSNIFFVKCDEGILLIYK